MPTAPPLIAPRSGDSRPLPPPVVSGVEEEKVDKSPAEPVRREGGVPKDAEVEVKEETESKAPEDKEASGGATGVEETPKIIKSKEK